MNGANFDFIDQLHRIKDMADFIRLYSSAGGEHGQNPPDAFDMEKMMRAIDMMHRMNEFMQNGARPGGNFHPGNFPPGNFSSDKFPPPDYFEHMADSPAIKSMKAALPYIELKYRRPLSVFIKLIEIQRLLDVYSDAMNAIGDQTGTDWHRGMLFSMRPYIDEDKRGMIDMLLQMLDMRSFLTAMQK